MIYKKGFKMIFDLRISNQLKILCYKFIVRTVKTEFM